MTIKKRINDFIDNINASGVTRSEENSTSTFNVMFNSLRYCVDFKVNDNFYKRQKIFSNDEIEI